METYILKSSACLLALFLFYKLLLEKESAHKLKRYYLLMSVFVSFIIPLISYTTYTEITASSLNIIENLTEIEKNTITNNNFFSLSAILWTIYGLITFIIGFNFIKNLYQILKKVKNNPKESDTQTTNVLLQEVTIPHTFLKYIFVNKFDYLNGKIPESVLLHEKSHAQQKHSLDVIFIEFLQVIFWFNPLIYFYKKSIKLNHEFLADEAVLNNGFHPKTYQQILLAYSSHAPQLALANAINYSSIKKRFTVMKTQTSKKTIWLRSLILLPMLALLLFSFVKHETIYITPKENNFQKDTQEKATKKMVAEYNKLAKKYNQKQINKYHYKEVERLTYIYKIMTPSQKKSAEPYPNFPPPPPPPTPKVSKAESKPYPPYPADANCFINDKEASMREVKKIASKDIQSVFIRANDKSGNKLKKTTLHIFTNDYRGVVAPKPPKTPVVKETKLPPPPPPPFPKNADFFINGKKVSLNDVNSLDYKKIQTVDIMKLDKDGKEAKNPTVYIITKGFNKNK